jgi:flagellar hook protein FlgE
MDVSRFTQKAADFRGTGTPNGQPRARSHGCDDRQGRHGIRQLWKATRRRSIAFRWQPLPARTTDAVERQRLSAPTARSGVTVTGFPQTNGFGTIQAGALEGSNVDLAGELTEMIESQRSYTANSKVFQTGSDIMDVLVNLKR